MQTKTLSVPEFMFIVVTRGLLGAGVGLLVADKLEGSARRAVGCALATIGALSTVPAALLLFGRRPQTNIAIGSDGVV